MTHEAMPQRRENDKFIKMTSRRYARKIEARASGADGEAVVEQWMRWLGYIVEATGPNAPHDRNVTCPQTGRTIRVEIKTSTYNPAGRGGRYQACIHHGEADLVIFVARNERDWPFIIPMADIWPLRNVAIWREQPESYTGKWRQYLNAWDNLKSAFEGACNA